MSQYYVKLDGGKFGLLMEQVQTALSGGRCVLFYNQFGTYIATPSFQIAVVCDFDGEEGCEEVSTLESVNFDFNSLNQFTSFSQINDFDFSDPIFVKDSRGRPKIRQIVKK